MGLVMKSMKWFIPWVVLILVASCNSSHKTDALTLEQQKQAIVNGRVVTGNDHLATLMLAYRTVEQYGENAALLYGEHILFCSSTLITPNFVLTAAHCVCDEEGDSESMRKGVYAYLAQSNSDIRAEFEIEAFYPHPGYGCDKPISTLDKDIALIKLKKPVPLDMVRPIAPLPLSLAITADEVDSKDGVTVVDVGFGVTNSETDPDDTKHEMMSSLYAYCPEKSAQSVHCSETVPAPYEWEGKTYTYDMELGDGFMYTRRGQGTHSSTCPGDSGGSMYIWRDGIPFVAGVHSHVSTYDCDPDSIAGSTIVTDSDDFIRSIVTDLPDDTPETNCSDGIDDNGYGRIDCNDPWCFHIPVCLPEICDDKIDNNDNGKVDCDDDECADLMMCQPEICDDKIDNNGDGKIDCNDKQCFNSSACRHEICDDNVDNNGNGKIDCDDEQCMDAAICQYVICKDKIDNDGDGKIDCDDEKCMDAVVCKPEICNDKIDNNEDGYVDCGDPQCADDDECMAQICDCSDMGCTHAKCIEICDDTIDNNGDGKIDCDDIRCTGAIQCKTENCNDHIDNNGDGLIDCDDPVCANVMQCLTEICDDKIDNNGDGKVDCDDPLCSERYVCNPYEMVDEASISDSGCSVLIRKSPCMPGWLALFVALGLVSLRRRNSREKKN